MPYGKIMLESRVTAPVCANARPCSEAPVCSVIDARAMMSPTKKLFVPRVAELPTCQKTLEAWARPARMTLRPDVTVSEDGIWKMKTAFAFHRPVSVRSPEEIARLDVDV